MDLGYSAAAVVPAAVPVPNSATAATSALATVMLPDAVACGASTTSAVRDGEGGSSIDTAPAFSGPTEPAPVSEATTQPARPTVPHKAVVACTNRREFMIPSPPPEPCTAKHATRLIFGSKWARAMTKTAGYQFLQKVSPYCNGPGATAASHDQLREPAIGPIHA